MQSQMANIKQTRQMMLNETKKLSDAQLLLTPEGFNNNILWNLGHVMASYHYFLYSSLQVSPSLGEDFFKMFSMGISPKD